MRTALRRVLDVPLYLVLPAWLVWVTVLSRMHGATFGFDFEVILTAARDILHGNSPYPAPTISGVGDEHQFVYPPAIALVMTPLTVMPQSVAIGLFVIVSTIALAGGMWLAGCRDWRCIGVTFTGFAVLHGLRLGSMSAVLACALCLAWRWRDQSYRCGLMLAIGVVAKLFLLPMVGWLVLTRRWMAAAVMTLVSTVVILGSWAAIGLHGLRMYPHLLDVLARLEQERGFSGVALAVAFGAGSAVAHVVAFLMAAGALVCTWFLGRRRMGGAHDVNRDRRVDQALFCAAVLASLLWSPIVWLNYLTILVAPLAVVAPRLSWPWAILPATWLLALFGTGTIAGQSGGDIWRIVAALVFASIPVALAVRRRPTVT